MQKSNWLSEVKFNSDGLIAAIAQDYKSGKVLMLAWMNAESLEKTLSSQTAVYWSRSRRKLWHKGEESGHVQTIKEIRLDCDSDAILLLVEQSGGIACHTGRHSCFYKRLEQTDGQASWQSADPVLKDPKQIYS